MAARAPQAVLFACGLNSVRSPMAESLLQRMFPQALYVKSAGVKKGELDPFAVAVMAELGQDISGHKPTTFEELDDWEGLNFDLIITLSPEAHHKALELTRTLAADVEYWPTQDPTGVEGNREQKLQAYREVCDGLLLRIPQAVFQGRRSERLTSPAPGIYFRRIPAVPAQSRGYRGRRVLRGTGRSAPRSAHGSGGRRDGSGSPAARFREWR